MVHNTNELKIPASFGLGADWVNLWYVRGIPNVYFPTKIVAEAAARAAFGHSENDHYSRVFFREFSCEIG